MRTDALLAQENALGIFIPANVGEVAAGFRTETLESTPVPRASLAASEVFRRLADLRRKDI